MIAGQEAIADAALRHIPVTKLDDLYNEWLAVSVAHAVVSGNYDTYLEWCSGSDKATGLSEKRYREQGELSTHSPEEELGRLIGWANEYGEGEFKLEPEPMDIPQHEQTALYLRTVFEPEDSVCICANGFTREQRYKVSELLERLEATHSIEEALGDYDHEKGVFICVNPLDGPRKAPNVTRMDSLVLEFDEAELGEQYAWLLGSGLPIAAITYSGGKSLHAIIRTDGAETEEEYREIFQEVYSYAESKDMKPDPACKDPSRLTRLAGPQRGEQEQYLVTVNLGPKTLREWREKHNKPKFFDTPTGAGGRPLKPVFRHERLAEWLMRQYKIMRFGGSDKVKGPLYKYDFDRGIYSEPDIGRMARGEIRTLKKREVEEVASFIRDMAPRVNPTAQNERYIAFKNGVFDLETGQLVEPRASMYLTSRIPRNYNVIPAPSILEECRKALLEWADGREELADLLEEIIGNCMESHIELWQKMIIIYGSAGTGKSVFSTVIEKILGGGENGNLSSMDLCEIADKFKTIGIMGKKANIRNDISHKALDHPDIAKQLVTGDRLTGEPKFGEPVSFVPCATLLFSCNAIPYMRDDKGGIARRLLIVPFDRVFSGETNKGKELDTPEMLEGFIYLGIQGLLRARKQGSYTMPECCKELLEEQREITNGVLAWLRSLGLKDWPEFEEFFKSEGKRCGETGWSRIQAECGNYCEVNNLLSYQAPSKLKGEIETYYNVPLKTEARRGIGREIFLKTS